MQKLDIRFKINILEDSKSSENSELKTLIKSIVNSRYENKELSKFEKQEFPLEENQKTQIIQKLESSYPNDNFAIMKIEITDVKVFISHPDANRVLSISWEIKGTALTHTYACWKIIDSERFVCSDPISHEIKEMIATENISVFVC